ncbi:MAG TPA: VCBS repeat-containing protein [Bryobacteraceae bacterium]|nr:VCBS repeat-containing protein [Bryobacteraceae bacterium]
MLSAPGDWLLWGSVLGALQGQPCGGVSGALRARLTASGASSTLGYGSQPIAAASLANGGLMAIRTGGAGVTISILSPGGSAFQTGGQYTTGPTPEHVIAADFNGDGNADLAVSNFGSLSTNSGGNIQIFPGKGDGTFSAGATLTAGATPVAMYAADFNGDGKLDLAVANPTANTISVLLGNGDGTF